MIGYLGKLDEVARLEIIGTYHQIEPDSEIDILHVFGTHVGRPHTYYYRQYVDSIRWTALQKVDCEIEGHHLIPIVWNRRLFLFWPVFEEKKDNSERRYSEVKIAWSERKDDRWLAKKLSTISIQFDYNAGEPPRFLPPDPINFILNLI